MNIIAIKRKSDGKSCYHLVVALFAINYLYCHDFIANRRDFYCI